MFVIIILFFHKLLSPLPPLSLSSESHSLSSASSVAIPVVVDVDVASTRESRRLRLVSSCAITISASHDLAMEKRSTVRESRSLVAVDQEILNLRTTRASHEKSGTSRNIRSTTVF